MHFKHTDFDSTKKLNIKIMNNFHYIDCYIGMSSFQGRQNGSDRPPQEEVRQLDLSEWQMNCLINSWVRASSIVLILSVQIFSTSYHEEGELVAIAIYGDGREQVHCHTGFEFGLTTPLPFCQQSEFPLFEALIQNSLNLSKTLDKSLIDPSESILRTKFNRDCC